MNKVIMIGNLTRDPELQTTSSGISVCRFSIAVNRNYSNSNGEREVDFFNIVAWRGLAENVSKYCFKGKKICVVGQLQTNKWTDEEGKPRASMDIIAEDVEFLSKPNNDGGDGKTTAENGNAQNRAQIRRDTALDVDEDDLPF